MAISMQVTYPIYPYLMGFDDVGNSRLVRNIDYSSGACLEMSDKIQASFQPADWLIDCRLSLSSGVCPTFIPNVRLP